MTTPEERTRAYYSGASGAAYHAAVHGRELESEAAFDSKALLAKHRYFRHLDRSARVFEFGVGTGVNLAKLDVAERAGFDVSETAAKHSRALGIEVYDSMEDVPEAHYDVVVCRHVLEHVTDPTETLTRLATKMDAGGRLLLILPVEGRPIRLRRVPKTDVNQHLFAWKLNHIVNLLAVCGMRVEAHRYEWYSMQRILGWVQRRFGSTTYSRAVSLAGRLRRQSEMVIWARHAQSETAS